MCFFSCDIDNCYCDICNNLVVYCVGLAYDVSLSEMIDSKVDSHLEGLINPYYYYLCSLWLWTIPVFLRFSGACLN